MSKEDDSGPAFPCEVSALAYNPDETWDVKHDKASGSIVYQGKQPDAITLKAAGMSLHDWFVGQALKGAARECLALCTGETAGVDPYWDVDRDKLAVVVRAALETADAVLEERKR